MGYVFFMSYAREDLENQRKTFDKLVDELFIKLGRKVPREQIGFSDEKGILNGEQWPDELARALRTSRVMICLHSPSYFNSEWCGKEWRIFRGRVEGYAQAQGLASPPALIQPVHWEPHDTPPAAVGAIQYQQHGFGDEYAELGLRKLMRLNKYQDQYVEFLDAFAKRVKDVYDQWPLPESPEVAGWSEVTNAFEVMAAPTVPPPAPAVGAAQGPAYARFVIVAGSQAELKQVRQALDAYGNDADGWRPFDPPTKKYARLLVESVISQVELANRGVLPVDKGLLKALDESERACHVVVILIDPWTLKVQEYRQILAGFDKVNLANCVIAVPWNDDAETRGHEKDLEDALLQTFPRKYDEVIQTKVVSPEALIGWLREKVVERQGRLLNIARVLRKAEGEGSPFAFNPIVSATTRTP